MQCGGQIALFAGATELLSLVLCLLAQPDGRGRYEWADGSVYDGRWKVRSVKMARTKQCSHVFTLGMFKLAVVSQCLTS